MQEAEYAMFQIITVAAFFVALAAPVNAQTGLSHIEAAHAIPELKPRMVADAVGTSLRTLQGVFAEREDAIARRIQNARMAAPARWLADPAMRKQKIGEIAIMAGFCELSHFTHAFVRTYKESPGCWRRRQLEE